MPTMVVFALFSLLLLAVLVLVVALLLLDSHADEQNKRLQDLMRGTVSGNQRTKSPNERAKDAEGGVSCHTCHICGGMRIRRPHGLVSAPVSDSKSCEASPWMQPLPLSEKLVANMKHVFQRLTNYQKSQMKGDIKRRLHSLGSSISARSWVEERARKNYSPCSPATSVSGASSSSKSSIMSASQGSGCSAALADTVSTKYSPSLTRSMASYGSSSNLVESTSESVTFVDEKSRDTELKPAPLRRLMLEILMSPSANGDVEPDTGNSPNGSGVKLKLETNALLEHLASLKNVPDLEFAIKDAPHKSKRDTKDPNVGRLFCLPVEVMPTRSDATDRSRTLPEQDMPISSLSVDQACSLPDAGISSLQFPFVESSLTGSSGVDVIMGDGHCAHARQRLSTVACDCLGQSDQEPCCDCSGLGPFTSATISSSTSAMAVKDALPNGKVKLGVSTPLNNGSPADLSSQSYADDKGEHCLASEEVAFVSLDGLGSLRITFLKGGADGRISEEGSREMSSQSSSALAALNVDSASTKVGGSECVFVSGNVQREESKTHSNVHSSPNNIFSKKIQNGGLQGDGTESECSVDEAGERITLQASKCRLLEEETTNSTKKEKKKKKNRGKKQKGKGGTLMSEFQERQEIGKIALEAAKHVSAVTETEIGCVCGAPKGGLHSNSCPYPFTSPGSMLQRKIKEQYDELVRSNAAKTLTLAQVGRFTTCLVEAKAALQQKSELIHRRFTIAKSLLAKADKSSFDRLYGQIYGIEIEQKKLEEDTIVYNRLQEQLKLSPAYKKMLEYGRTHFELQTHTGQMIEKLEPEDMEMSFEELLAQEKKDAFWKKHGLSRSSVPVS